MIVFGLILVISFVFIFLPVILSKISFVEKLLDLLYPLGDLLILGPALFTLLALRYGVLGRPWTMVLTGFTLMSLADILFSYLTFFEIYQTGHPVDLLWIAGYLIVGLASVNQIEVLTS